MLWIFDVRLPDPNSITTAALRRFATFAAPGTLIPAISALIVTRVVLRESWRSLTLDRLGRRSFYMWAWLLMPALALAAVALSLLLRAASFDPQLTYTRQLLMREGLSVRSTPELWRGYIAMVALQLAIVPLLNLPMMIGEELGWRGFLLPRLMSIGMGQWSAMLASGAIWGLWHAPIMMRGQYPGHPYLGPLLTIPYCAILGVIFGWLWLGSGSVWVCAIAHASLDVSAGAFTQVLVPGLDYAVAGALSSIIGWIPLISFIAYLMWSRRLPVQLGESEATTTIAFTTRSLSRSKSGPRPVS